MKRFVLGIVLAVGATSAQADIYGLVANRTADVLSAPPTTIAGGISIEGDITTFAGQFGYKTHQNLVTFGTLGFVDLDGVDSGISIGGGLVYQLAESPLDHYNMAIKGSYHRFSGDTSTGDFTGSDFGVEVIASPVDQNVVNGGDVFGFIGLHRLYGKATGTGFGTTVSASDTETELAIGAGVIVPWSGGELFGTIELIDDVFIGGGYRVEWGAP